MQGLVPAAGEGTRLRPLTSDRPKGLVNVGDRPLLTHVFETLTDLGVSDLVVVVGYRGDQIRDYYGDAFEGIPITYVEQPARRGLAHAVALAGPHLSGGFLLLNGDNVCRAALDAVVEHHQESEAVATMPVERVSPERAAEGGVVDRQDGAVVGLVEKPDEPPSRLIPRGFYALDQEVVHACHLVRPGHTGERELTAALDLLLTAGWPVETVPLEGWCVNVNTPADVESVETRLVDDQVEDCSQSGVDGRHS
jgi:glucose-1-phosphate thymidylyltransferase